MVPPIFTTIIFFYNFYNRDKATKNDMTGVYQEAIRPNIIGGAIFGIISFLTLILCLIALYFDLKYPNKDNSTQLTFSFLAELFFPISFFGSLWIFFRDNELCK